MSLFSPKRNYTPLPRRMVHRELRIRVWVLLIYMILFAVGIIGGYVAVADSLGLPRRIPPHYIVRLQALIPPLRAPTSQTLNPTAQPKKIVWKTYRDSQKEFEFRYPESFELTPSSGFLNNISLTDRTQRTTRLEFSEGRSSSMPSTAEIRRTERTYHIGASAYRVDEIVYADGWHLADIALTHPSHDFHIQIHTRPNPQDDADATTKREQIIAEILKSFTFTDIQADWTEYRNDTFGYYFFIPNSWQAVKSSDPSSEWGADSLIEVLPPSYHRPLIRLQFTKTLAPDEVPSDFNTTTINNLPFYSFDSPLDDPSQVFIKKYLIQLAQGEYLRAIILPIAISGDTFVPPGTAEIWLRDADLLINSIRKI